MRIVFFSHYFPPEVNAPASRTFEHCVRWVQRGHDVTVVTCAPNCPDGILYPGYKNTLVSQVEHLQGIKVVRVWTYLAPNAGTIRRIVNYLSYMATAVARSLALEHPHVLVATSPQFFCGWAGVIASWLKRVPLVLEIRDIWPESIKVVGAMRNGWLLRSLEKLEWRLYRSARHIVTVAEGYRDNIQRKAGPTCPISVIPNGVDLARYVPGQQNGHFRHRWNLDGKFLCSYVGTIGMAHGLNVVIEAASILKAKRRTDVAFCLVGDGASRCTLQDEVKARNLDDMIVLTGRQPKDEMPEILASSDACLVHLRKNALFETVIPSKMFEAMAMERPIIMGVLGQAWQIVCEAQAGVAMEPESAESLVGAVETLSANRDRAARLGRSGRAYVAQHYDRDQLAAQYLNLLESVATTRR